MSAFVKLFVLYSDFGCTLHCLGRCIFCIIQVGFHIVSIQCGTGYLFIDFACTGAYDSAKWQSILYNLYDLLVNEINLISSRGKYSSASRNIAVKENLIELMADICHQVTFLFEYKVDYLFAVLYVLLFKVIGFSISLESFTDVLVPFVCVLLCLVINFCAVQKCVDS